MRRLSLHVDLRTPFHSLRIRVYIRLGLPHEILEDGNENKRVSLQIHVQAKPDTMKRCEEAMRHVPLGGAAFPNHSRPRLQQIL